MEDSLPCAVGAGAYLHLCTEKLVSMEKHKGVMNDTTELPPTIHRECFTNIVW